MCNAKPDNERARDNNFHVSDNTGHELCKVLSQKIPVVESKKHNVLARIACTTNLRARNSLRGGLMFRVNTLSFEGKDN
jgi:hypothetical protein